jgi:hypothetical protein
MVYPQAPLRTITWSKKDKVSSWYDILADPSKLLYLKPDLTFKEDDIKA